MRQVSYKNTEIQFRIAISAMGVVLPLSGRDEIPYILKKSYSCDKQRGRQGTRAMLLPGMGGQE